MNDFLIGFGLILAPILSVVLLAYLIGRNDGRRAERHRRLTCADSILAKKHRDNVVRL